jgi:acyl-CoA thioester hydrolase
LRKTGNMLTHRMKIRVIYGDTDNMGFAYHANYFRWFEAARTEMFRAWGLPYTRIEEKGFFLPVSEAHCKFTSPVKYDDLLEIETTLDRSVKAGMKFDYNVYVNNHDSIVANGYTIHPCLNSENKVVRPPSFLQEIIKKNTEPE